MHFFVVPHVGAGKVPHTLRGLCFGLVLDEAVFRTVIVMIGRAGVQKMGDDGGQRRTFRLRPPELGLLCRIADDGDPPLA
jgi:hypothetical protein